MHERILVPMGESDAGREAFEHGLTMAEREGADLHLLHVVDTNRYGEPALSSVELVVDAQADAGGEVLRRQAGRAQSHGVDTVAHNCHGDPTSEVLQYVDEHDVDAVVLCRPGRDDGTVSQVARRSLEHMSVDVEVV